MTERLGRNMANDPTRLLAAAARRALRERFAGTTDDRGYVRNVGENLLPGVRPEYFEAELRKGSGEELKRKFRAVHSSSCLAVNSFAWFKDRPHLLSLLGRRAPTVLAFEKQLRIFPNRQPANLDVWLQFDDATVAIESKLLEWMTPKRAAFAPVYDDLAPPFAEPRWWAAYLAARSGEPQHLDRAQLLKHYFGLRRLQIGGGADTPLALLYLFWEPTNWSQIPECRRHRSQVEEFAGQVAGGEIEFAWTTYGALWSEWEQQPGARQHVADLRARYEVAVDRPRLTMIRREFDMRRAERHHDM